jgi:hypothetical protein
VVALALTTAAPLAIPAAAPARGPLKLLLHANSGDGTPRFCTGEAISISLSLIDERFHLKRPTQEGDGPSERLTVGGEGWSWFKGLAIQILRQRDDEKGRSQPVPVLGDFDWAKHMAIPCPGSWVGTQPGEHALVSVFTLPPAITESLAPGRYILKGTWDSAGAPAPNKSIWRGRLVAEPLEITIRTARSERERAELAYGRGIYFLKHNSVDAALSEALKVEKILPGHRLSQCYVLAARAYEAKGDAPSALRYYRRFLDTHKNIDPDRWPYLVMVRHKVAALEAELKAPPKGGRGPRD